MPKISTQLLLESLVESLKAKTGGRAYIKLTKGRFAVIDWKDFNDLIQFAWHLTSHGYASRNRKYRTVPRIEYMHRRIAAAPDGMEVDHINGDKLDNRRANLRVCSRSQNAYNMRARKDNKARIKGVHFISRANRWCAQIGFRNKNHYLGIFKTAEEAKAAYNAAAIKHHGEFRNL